MQNVVIYKNLTVKGTLYQVFFCLRHPPLLGFCLGWSSNFEGSESGQIQSVKLLQIMPNDKNDNYNPPSLSSLCVAGLCVKA
jgi:hypothetical protein